MSYGTFQALEGQIDESGEATMTAAEILEARVLTDPSVFDVDRHHELVGVERRHGRKLDYGKIALKSELGALRVRAALETLEEYGLRPDVFLSVANGTNELVHALAARVCRNTVGLQTEKIPGDNAAVRLSSAALSYLKSHPRASVLVVEDVSKSGAVALSAVESVLRQANRPVEVLVEFQRAETLAALDARAVDYTAVIRHPLEDFAPEICEKQGFCAARLPLVRYGAD